jgi:hypothetical protein
MDPSNGEPFTSFLPDQIDANHYPNLGIATNLAQAWW